MSVPYSVGAIPDFSTPVKTPGVPYLAYHLTADYTTDEGMEIVPVAGPPGTPPEIIALHAGYTLKRVLYLIVRLDMKAQLPDPNTNNSQEVLMNQRIAGSAPGRLSDGTGYLVLFGEYLFALTVVPGPTDTLYFGTTPVDNSSPAPESLYTASDFIQGIISGAPQLNGATGGKTPAANALS